MFSFDGMKGILMTCLEVHNYNAWSSRNLQANYKKFRNWGLDNLQNYASWLTLLCRGRTPYEPSDNDEYPLIRLLMYYYEFIVKIVNVFLPFYECHLKFDLGKNLKISRKNIHFIFKTKYSIKGNFATSKCSYSVFSQHGSTALHSFEIGINKTLNFWIKMLCIHFS